DLRVGLHLHGHRGLAAPDRDDVLREDPVVPREECVDQGLTDHLPQGGDLRHGVDERAVHEEAHQRPPVSIVTYLSEVGFSRRTTAATSRPNPMISGGITFTI